MSDALTKFAKSITGRFTNREWILLLSLFGAALAIRSIGIRWGLPSQILPHSRFLADEPNVLDASFALTSGAYQVNIIRYQPTFYFVSAGFFLLYFVMGLTTGKFENLTDFQAAYLQNTAQFILVGRYFMVFQSAIMVILTYVVGRAMFGKRAGFFASLFMLFSFGDIVFAKVFRLDSFMPFIFLLAFYMIIRLERAKPERLRPFVICGIAVALVSATKITGFALLIPFLLVPFVFEPSPPLIKIRRLKLDKRVPFMFVVFLGTYLALTAFAYIYGPRIVKSAARRLDKSGTYGYLTTISPFKYSLPWHLTSTLPRELGIPVYGLSILGLIMMLFDRERRSVIILLFAAIFSFILPIGYLSRTAWRDMLPILPLLAIAAGYGLDRAIHIITDHLHLKNRKVMKFALVIGILILILLFPAINLIRQKALIVSKDTRDAAKEWIELNIPAGTNIAVEPYGPGIMDKKYIAYLEESLLELGYGIESENFSQPEYDVFHPIEDLRGGKDVLKPDELLDYLIRNGIEYYVTSSAYYARFYNDAIGILYPDREASGQEFHDLIASYLVPIEVFVPDTGTAPGPLIRIYQVPADIALANPPIAGSFEPFEGMEIPASALGYFQFSPR